MGEGGEGVTSGGNGECRLDVSQVSNQSSTHSVHVRVEAFIMCPETSKLMRFACARVGAAYATFSRSQYLFFLAGCPPVWLLLCIC